MPYMAGSQTVAREGRISGPAGWNPNCGFPGHSTSPVDTLYPFQGSDQATRSGRTSHYDPKKPQWVPIIIGTDRYDARNWGFSLSHEVYKTLSDDEYIVRIDTDIDNEGSLKVVDYWLKGEKPDTIFVAAHTCHPGQATDGLTNVAVALELFHYLKSLDSRRNSYRLILGPEYFAAAAFLSRTPQSDIDALRGGIFLDMFGSGEPSGFSSRITGILDWIVRWQTSLHITCAIIYGGRIENSWGMTKCSITARAF